MAPVPYPFEYEASPTGFPSLLRRVWLRLYPQGEDPMFQVYCEKLADYVHEYRAEVFLFSSSTYGSLSRSAKGGPASTPEHAILYASIRLSLTCVMARSREALASIRSIQSPPPPPPTYTPVPAPPIPPAPTPPTPAVPIAIRRETPEEWGPVDCYPCCSHALTAH